MSRFLQQVPSICSRILEKYLQLVRGTRQIGLTAAERKPSFRDVAALDDLVHAILAHTSGEANRSPRISTGLRFANAVCRRVHDAVMETVVRQHQGVADGGANEGRLRARVVWQGNIDVGAREIGLTAAERKPSFRDVAALDDLVHAILADTSGEANPRAHVVPSIGVMSDCGGGRWR
jgi:hypothetical protein